MCSENSQIMYSDPSILRKIPKNDHFFRPLPWDSDFEIVEFCDLNIIIFRLNYDKKVNFVNFFSKKSAFFAFFGQKMTIFSKQIRFQDSMKHFGINFCGLCFWIENHFHKVVPKFFVEWNFTGSTNLFQQKFAFVVEQEYSFFVVQNDKKQKQKKVIIKLHVASLGRQTFCWEL